MAWREYTIIEYKKFRFSQVQKDFNRIRQTRHFQPMHSGVNNEHFYTVFSIQSIFLNKTIHSEIICKHKPKKRAGKSENWTKLC